jgi:hypothetical protein
MGKATSRVVSLVRFFAVDLCDLCGREKVLTTGDTEVHREKPEETPTPDYMHCHASAASTEMD